MHIQHLIFHLVCFLEDDCSGEGTFAADHDECCALTGAKSFRNPQTKTCDPCLGMAYV